MHCTCNRLMVAVFSFRSFTSSLHIATEETDSKALIAAVSVFSFSHCKSEFCSDGTDYGWESCTNDIPSVFPSRGVSSVFVYFACTMDCIWMQYRLCRENFAHPSCL